MGFTESIRTCLSKYFTFSGRAARPEFWWFVLFATMHQQGGDEDQLRTLAAILGVNGILLVFAAQFVMTVLLIWWCSRPGEPGVNAWGAPPLR